MKLNFGKTKFMLFNPCRIYDFQPEFVECVEQMNLLCVTLRSDLRWWSNTEDITKWAYARLWAVRRLVKCGASKEDMVDIYTKQVRSVLEFGVPVWNSALKGSSGLLPTLYSAARILSRCSATTTIGDS